tara:strand:- start:171 stop:758 length:588 start_codon:yes stop_codon:yes gene_type:complete
MARNIHLTKEPVTLTGFQSILKPSKFGYTLKALVGSDIVDALEKEREDCLKWAESKLKNPKRSTLKPEPWEEVEAGKYLVKFSWADDKRPPVVDTEGTPITNKETPVYEGSKVKIGFHQKPYVLRDGVTYGTSLKLNGIQIVSIQSGAGVDTGDLDEVGVAELFGKTKGFKADDPNVTPDLAPSSVETEQYQDDF